MTVLRSWHAAPPSVDTVEPFIPVVLGAHGLAIVAVGVGPSWTVLPFLLIAVTGVLGLLGWRSRSARLVRAGACIATTVVLSVLEPELVPSLLQWYYAVAAVYPLVVAGPVAPAIGPITGACYVAQVAAGSVAVPYPVAFLRAGVLTALALATWSAGLAYRAATREADDRRVAAERVRRELEHSGTHDELTGLPNRLLLHRRLEECLSEDHSAALLLLDLDRFKEVNDTLGHRYGDQLLRQVGARLVEATGAGPTVSRLGGDEFAVLLCQHDEATATETAARLRAALHEPFLVQEALIAVDVSIGVALAPQHGTDGDQLLQVADVAMYDAKARGQGHAVYDPRPERYTADRLMLLGELRGAISRGELVVEYQPKVETVRLATVGMEALVRWDHPTRGRIAPDVFIPLAERSGEIRPLTAFVLDTALGQCRLWRDAGLDLAVSVNLSARNLDQDDLPDQVARSLAQHGLDGSQLELEITESFLMADPVRARDLLRELADLGVRLAIDDFGTGLSSLAYLKNLPVQVLKIDKSFVTHMLADPTDALIVEGVANLAASMGLGIVAEGVEDEPTLDRLRTIGCTHVQGWFLGRPLPAERVIAWCRAAAANC